MSGSTGVPDPFAAELARQGARLAAQLAALAGADPHPAADAALARVAAAATELRAALRAVPAEVSAALASAELGFMPGPTLEGFVAKHRADWDKELGSLTAGAVAVAGWADAAEGPARYRAFLVRGYLRGFAHQWRLHRKSEPPLEAGSEFVTAVAAELGAAGISGDTVALLRSALASDWRTG